MDITAQEWEFSIVTTIKVLLTIRFVLFSLFFLAGAGAMVLAILARPELENYYHNRARLAAIQAQNDTIRDLTDQYAAQAALIEADPNILYRFSATTFGRKPTAPDTVFPEGSNAALRAAAEAIIADQLEPPPAEPTPGWLLRILEPNIRRGLFLTGCGLVLMTFIFFGTVTSDDAGDGTGRTAPRSRNR
jgi:hypothetical protein